MIKKRMNRLILAYYSRYDKPDRRKKHQFIKRAYGIDIGKYTYGYNLSQIARGTKIGAFCSIAPGVSIGLMNHPTQYVSTHPFLYYKSRGFIDQNAEPPQQRVIIADDVWLGTNAVILPGVSIGQGAIVGAGAVVTKDVPPYAIVGGVPGRLIRYRFEDEVVERLSRIQWGSWDDGKIKEHIKLFYDPTAFLEEENRI